MAHFLNHSAFFPVKVVKQKLFRGPRMTSAEMSQRRFSKRRGTVEELQKKKKDAQTAFIFKPTNARKHEQNLPSSKNLLAMDLQFSGKAKSLL